MYFPVADIQCHPLVPFAAAALIAFVTSMGGVSGAVVLLPFQMSVLGYAGPGVSATNQIFNILACPAGVWRYWKEGRLLWPLAVIIAGGTLPGVFLGAFVRLRWLPDASRFKLFAAAVLLFVGGRMLLASRKKRGGMKGRPD
ncbi:MAG: sulfite exporter TauE/SafE family protein, partial [Desulfovibrio sp.]